MEVRAAKGCGVRRRYADQVAGVGESGVGEGNRRPERVDVHHIEHLLVHERVGVPVDDRSRQVVALEVLPAEFDRVQVDVGTGHVPLVRGGADAPNPRGRHRVEIVFGSRFAVTVRSQTATVRSRFSSCTGLKNTSSMMASPSCSGTSTSTPPSQTVKCVSSAFRAKGIGLPTGGGRRPPVRSGRATRRLLATGTGLSRPSEPIARAFGFELSRSFVLPRGVDIDEPRVEEWETELADVRTLTPDIVSRILSAHDDRGRQAIEAVSERRVKEYRDFVVVVGFEDEYIVEDGMRDSEYKI